MGKAFRVGIGGPGEPFNRGINTARHRSLLAINEAVDASGVDLSAGTLKGAAATEGTAATVGTACKFIAFVGDDHWVDTQYPDWACNDSDLAGVGRTYRTNHATDTTAGHPQYHLGANTYRLGLDYETTAPTASAGARPLTRSYAVTFYSTTTGFESNPTRRTTAVASGASLSGIPRYSVVDTSGMSGTVHRRIYATEEGDPDGTLYYYDTITNDTATTYTDAGGEFGGALTANKGSADYSIAGDSPDLDWGAGGNVDSDTTPFDQSPAPFLTVISEGMMGTEGSAGLPIGAVGSVVRWPHAGKPWAWPDVHQHDVQEYVEAAVVWQGQGFVFTASSVWAFTGAADYAITPIKTGAGHGIKAGCGRTAKATPFGIVYLSREGLALFDGTTSRLLTGGVLDPSFAYTSSHFNAEYFDGFYLLNSHADADPWCFDLRRGPGGLIATQANFGTVGAMAVANKLDFGLLMPGAALYVADYSTGAIRAWRPSLGASASREAGWSWLSGSVTLGVPGLQKRLDRLRVAAVVTGGATLRVTLGVTDDLGAIFGSLASFHTVDVSAGFVDVRLPAGLIGRCFHVSIAPLSGGSNIELLEVELRGEVLDAS